MSAPRLFDKFHDVGGWAYGIRAAASFNVQLALTGGY
jgi:hypothetical protein